MEQERLLRRLRLERPHTLPIIVYVCAPPKSVPHSFHACDGLYSDVARRYGVAELSLRSYLRGHPEVGRRARVEIRASDEPSVMHPKKVQTTEGKQRGCAHRHVRHSGHIPLAQIAVECVYTADAFEHPL